MNTYAEYAAIKAINATALKQGCKSMKHMRAQMDGMIEKDTASMSKGLLIHAAVLEPTFFTDLVAVYDGTRRGKEWDKFDADNAGKTILKPYELEYVTAAWKSVQSHKEAMKLLDGGAKEQTVTWSSEKYGKAKARWDAYKAGKIIEVKSAANIEMRGFVRSFEALNYDVQIGWYAEGMSLFGGAMSPDIRDIEVYIICIENSYPFDVAVRRVPQSVITIGNRKAVKLAEQYRACEVSGVFPGQSETVEELEMSSYYGEGELSEGFFEGAASGLGIGE